VFLFDVVLLMPRGHNSSGFENNKAFQTFGWILLFSVVFSLYSLYKILEPKSVQAQIEAQAFVTLVTNSNDLIGAKVLGHSLLKSTTTRRFVIMVTETVTENEIAELNLSGFKIVKTKSVEVSFGNELFFNETLSNLGGYSKIMTWELNFDKVIYLEPRCVVLKNIDELFALEPQGLESFSAVMDCCERFDDSMFMAYPSRKTLTNMLESVKRLKPIDLEEGVEGFFNDYFSNWKQLPFQFNAQQKHLLTLSEKSWKLNQIKVICYDEQPPWNLHLHQTKKMETLNQPWIEIHEEFVKKENFQKGINSE